MTVAYPDRRQDILNALDSLAAEPPPTLRGNADPRWPDLTNAVHWLIDDTWWDKFDPMQSIGTLLRNEAEARAVAAVVKAIDEVSARQGARAPDRDWFADEAWPIVRQLAAEAAGLLRAE
jgi:hypothetical protein